MNLFTISLLILAALLALEKVWRCALIARFFRRPPPRDTGPKPRRVSILQPVVGGDPTLARCLESSLRMRTDHTVEFWYLLDEGDAGAERICRDLEARYPERVSGVLLLPPPPEGISPKMFKLIAGQKASRGDIVCCLDDDTALPDGALEVCLPYLSQPGVGLAFGLPYYVHFGNVWSAYVSCFVNASSLLTYIPYTALCPPFTINGMFFVVRREILDSVGGFAAAEEVLADDFGTAHLFRTHGYILAQTPLRHGISTHVRDLNHLRGLLGRWFTFPRESLLRHLSPFEKAVVLLMGAAANLLPVALVLGALLSRSGIALTAAGAFLLFALIVIACLDRAYLRRATPTWALCGLMPLVLLLFPLQMLVALLAPRPRVHWRGNIMEAQKGGGFRFLTRRTMPDADS